MSSFLSCGVHARHNPKYLKMHKFEHLQLNLKGCEKRQVMSDKVFCSLGPFRTAWRQKKTESFEQAG